LWSNVLHLIALKPLTGWGLGELSFAHFDTLYDGPRFCEILDNAHNLPLHIAVTFGVPAALLACIAAIVAMVRARPWRSMNPQQQLAWSACMVIGVHSLLEYPLWYAPFQLAALCVVLLWCGVERRQKWLMAQGTQMVAGLVFVCCAYGAWDYWRISQIYLSADSRAPMYRDDTLQKIENSWLFGTQVRFARLSVTPLDADSPQSEQAAATQLELATDLLHFSPEPMVVQKVLESAGALGCTADFAYYSARFRAAYPDAYKAFKTLPPKPQNSRSCLHTTAAATGP